MNAAFLIIGGVILNRFDVSWFIHVLGQWSNYSPHWMEVALLVGVIAGLVLVYSLITRYFPVYEETVAYEKPSAASLQLEKSPRSEISVFALHFSLVFVL